MSRIQSFGMRRRVVSHRDATFQISCWFLVQNSQNSNLLLLLRKMCVFIDFHVQGRGSPRDKITFYSTPYNYPDMLSQSLLSNKALRLLMQQKPCAAVPDYQGT